MKIELDKQFWEKLKVRMKKDIKKEKKTSILSKSNINKSYYVLLICMVSLATFSIYNNIDLQDSVLDEKTASVFADNDSNNIIEQNSNANNDETRFSDETIITSLEYKPISPINNENLIESSFLDGITEIKAKNNSDVLAIANGKVEYVYIDYCYGYTVLINHGNNIKSKYSNLDSNLFVTTGQNINMGEKIGTTINSDTSDISIMYFTTYYENEPININKMLEL